MRADKEERKSSLRASFPDRSWEAEQDALAFLHQVIGFRAAVLTMTSMDGPLVLQQACDVQDARQALATLARIGAQIAS